MAQPSKFYRSWAEYKKSRNKDASKHFCCCGSRATKYSSRWSDYVCDSCDKIDKEILKRNGALPSTENRKIETNKPITIQFKYIEPFKCGIRF